MEQDKIYALINLVQSDTGERAWKSHDAIKVFENDAIERGRESILKDFDIVCAADAFLGFSDEEWTAVKKFFALNKAIAESNGKGWDDKKVECGHVCTSDCRKRDEGCDCKCGTQHKN